MTLKLITQPTIEPITLDEAKAHLRVTSNADDALISASIAAAREWAEIVMQRAIMPQTYELICDDFPRFFKIPMGRVTEIVSLKYLDVAGDEQTLDPDLYQTDLDDEPAFLFPEYATSWPAVSTKLNAVRLRYVVGYESLGDVPNAIQAAIKLTLGWLYERRESVVTGGALVENPAVKNLLFAHRVHGA